LLASLSGPATSDFTELDDGWPEREGSCLDGQVPEFGEEPELTRNLRWHTQATTTMSPIVSERAPLTAVLETAAFICRAGKLSGSKGMIPTGWNPILALAQ
jgi:hypothetical protein